MEDLFFWVKVIGCTVVPIAFYVCYATYTIKHYFGSKLGKELFNGDTYDREVTLKYSILLFFKNYVKSQNFASYVILCDQVTRHVYRYKPFFFSCICNIDPITYTRLACDEISKVYYKSDFDVVELTFLSLCVRHDLRDAHNEMTNSFKEKQRRGRKGGR